MVSSERDGSHKRSASIGSPQTAGTKKDMRIQSKQRTGPDGHGAKEENMELGRSKNLPGNVFRPLIRSRRGPQTAKTPKRYGKRYGKKNGPRLEMSSFFSPRNLLILLPRHLQHSHVNFSSSAPSPHPCPNHYQGNGIQCGMLFSFSS